MRYAVSRLDLGSVFKIAFVLYGILGLVLAFFYSLAVLVISQIGSGLFDMGGNEFFQMGRHAGVVAVFLLGIGFAFVYAIMGASVMTLFAAVYNALARWMGGIAVELSPFPPQGSLPESPAPPRAAWQPGASDPGEQDTRR